MEKTTDLFIFILRNQSDLFVQACAIFLSFESKIGTLIFIKLFMHMVTQILNTGNILSDTIFSSPDDT